MTNEQKLLAVADAAERLRAERTGWATLSELLKNPEAQRLQEPVQAPGWGRGWRTPRPGSSALSGGAMLLL